MSGRGAAPEAPTSGHGYGSKGTIGSIPQAASARKPPTKQSRVLRLLLVRPHDSFEIGRLAHDHCPHTTISLLKKHGLEILSEPVTVPGFAGVPVRIARYTLAEGSRAPARQLLDRSEK